MRPNVLLLMADQLAAGWLPAYGHEVVQAPHVDALARESVVFDSASCASPLCGPSRAALLTGKLPSRTGVYDNAAELPASEPTIAHRLRLEGYRTCLAGKMHFVGPDQLHGYEERLTTDIYPADLEWTPDWERPLDDPLPWYHTMEAVRTPAVAHASTTRSPSTRSAACTTSPATAPTSRSSSPSRSPIRTTPGSCGPRTGTATSAPGSTSRPCRRSRSTKPTPTAGGCARCPGSTGRS